LNYPNQIFFAETKDSWSRPKSKGVVAIRRCRPPARSLLEQPQEAKATSISSRPAYARELRARRGEMTRRKVPLDIAGFPAQLARLPEKNPAGVGNVCGRG